VTEDDQGKASEPSSKHQVGKMSLLRVAVAGFLTILSWRSADAEEADGFLLDYAVAINQSGQSRSGIGVYFGNGLVLTASHVVGSGPFHRTQVTIAGQQLPARTIKQDTFEQSDLALLSIDEQQLPTGLRQRRISMCELPPWPGEDVVVVVPEEAVHSRIISPVWLPLQMRQYSTVINDVARTGNSGSGVFDAQKKCLLGIMSRKISQLYTPKDTGKTATIDIAKYFVPASRIKEFLPADILDSRRQAEHETDQPAQ
jgi:S1-C subfamily serine protease